MKCIDLKKQLSIAGMLLSSYAFGAELIQNISVYPDYHRFTVSDKVFFKYSPVKNNLSKDEIEYTLLQQCDNDGWEEVARSNQEIQHYELKKTGALIFK